MELVPQMEESFSFRMVKIHMTPKFTFLETVIRIYGLKMVNELDLQRSPLRELIFSKISLNPMQSH